MVPPISMATMVQVWAQTSISDIHSMLGDIQDFFFASQIQPTALHDHFLFVDRFRPINYMGQNIVNKFAHFMRY